MHSKALLDSLDAGVAAVAPDWTIVEWSGGAAEITGLPAHRAIGTSLWMAFPTAKGTLVEQVLQEVRLDGRPRTYLAPARTPDFTGMVFETRVTRGPRDQLVLLFRPVRQELAPESRAAQILTAFEGERLLYAQLFESLPIPALVLTVEGQILEANPEGRTLLGAVDLRALRGLPLAQWAPAAQRPAFAAVLREAVTTRQRCDFVVEFAGEPARTVHAVVENIAPGPGVPKLLFLAVDVSREVLLQRKLLEADRLSQLGGLVSGVAHELNNPLAAIAAFAEVLKLDGPRADLRESAEVIHTEAMRAGRVVQTLLDFARQRPHQRQPVDIKDVVARVVALHRSALRKAGILAVDLIPDDVPAVVGDPQELQQVLLNALVNAEQAIAATGRPGRVTFSSRRINDHLVVLVEDTGPGVAPEALGRVFEPFFTTKGDEGTGLGLAISNGLVRGMGGRMRLVNVEGGGAQLSVELPVDTAPLRPAAAEAAGRPGRALSLLVVEDEDSVRRAFELMAGRLGHRVTSAAGFAEAVARLRAPKGRYDAMIVDVHLDESHSGFDLFETLRLEGRGRETRVVFTTGDSISKKTRDLLQLSARPVLRKPFNLEELREVLERVA